jgi:formamidopyrimidine-DNA glycosylase
MPERPDLEAIRAFLNERIVGAEIARAEALIPDVFRTPRANFEDAVRLYEVRWGGSR